jgi:hypothetical protein
MTTSIRREMDVESFRFKFSMKARMVLTSGKLPAAHDSGANRGHSLFAEQFLQVLESSKFVMSGKMLALELRERLRPVAAQRKPDEAPVYSRLQGADCDLGADFFFVPSPAERIAAVF